MHILTVTTWINAAPEKCFDLARSVDVHLQSAADTGERVVGGRASGLLELGDEITFEARHFGIVQRLSSRVTEFEPPTFFQDRMIQGAFRMLEHDHRFEPKDGGTMMIDTLRFTAPLGPLGWAAERLFLASHLRQFLIHRGKVLKELAEQPFTTELPLSDGGPS